MSVFINEYELLNSNSDSAGNFCENSVLTTNRFQTRWPQFYFQDLLSDFIWDHCWTGRKFTNLPQFIMEHPSTNPNDLNISADQLLGYSCVSPRACQFIYDDMKFMHYDGRYIEAKVWAFICYKNTKHWYYKAILKKACKISIKKFIKDPNHTSGVLKVWDIYNSLGWSLPKGVNFDAAFARYYEESHPINKGTLRL